MPLWCVYIYIYKCMSTLIAIQYMCTYMKYEVLPESSVFQCKERQQLLACQELGIDGSKDYKSFEGNGQLLLENCEWNLQGSF